VIGIRIDTIQATIVGRARAAFADVNSSSPIVSNW
jgi:hypothetical protein